MRTLLSFRTLESRIYTTFTMIIFITILIIQFISYRFTNSRVSSAMLDNSRSLLYQLSDQVDAYLSGMDRIADVLADDADIQQYLADRMGSRSGMDGQIGTEVRTGTEAQTASGGAGQDAELRRMLELRLKSYVESRDDISHILLVSASGDYLFSDNPDISINPATSVQEKDWFIDSSRNPGKTLLYPAYVQNLFEDHYTWVVSLSRGIVDPQTSELLGVALIDLKFTRIRDLSQSMVTGSKGYNFILDERGNYIYHPFQQLIYSGLKSEPLGSLIQLRNSGGEKVLYSGRKYYQVTSSPQSGWLLVSVVDRSDINSNWEFSRLMYSIIGLVLFLVVGFITNSISRGITKPIRQLQEVMKSVDTGVLKTVGSLQATFEIRELAREYDVMVRRIRELVRINNRDQELKRKSDLRALQAQINPHFLYNTLDSIIWMSELGDNKAAIQMTSALSKLFRISISKGKEFIRVEEEIQHVESYLKIQKMRYKEKFEYSFQVDPDLYGESCLKIILQPLVENAIYHGIKENEGKGEINIDVYSDSEGMCFEVKDNGQGMESSELGELRAWLEREYNEQTDDVRSGVMVPKAGGRKFGTGVKNVHERVRLYYGRGFGVGISSEPGVGTTVRVRVPMHWEEDII